MRYIGVMVSRSSGSLLRDARTRAGLTQAELAERAGTTQSVISAYEHDRRQPALSTLADLVSATGLELEVTVRTRRRPIDRLTGPLGVRVRQQRRRLVEVASQHGVTHLRVFGSVARGEEGENSDLDLLVDLPPGMGLLDLGRARQALEEIVEAVVDLVPSEGLKPDVAARVEQDLVAL
jgi:predicted nucleotidyltransferase/DNA-binding XRE family transcriptional regulator